MQRGTPDMAEDTAAYIWGVAASNLGIIGDVALQGRIVVFDREKNEVGFGALKSCQDAA